MSIVIVQWVVLNLNSSWKCSNLHTKVVYYNSALKSFQMQLCKLKLSYAMLLTEKVYHKGLNNRFQQDWVAFMSQPYWVEVMVEVELRLILRLKLSWGWFEPGFDLRLRLSWGWGLVEVEIDLWLGLSWGWDWVTICVEVELRPNLSWSRVESSLVYSYRQVFLKFTYINW